MGSYPFVRHPAVPWQLMVELASNRARRISGRFLFGKNLAIAAARGVHATPTVAHGDNRR